jgi:hypothetical protein
VTGEHEQRFVGGMEQLTREILLEPRSDARESSLPLEAGPA